MSEIEDRRQRAREAFYDRMGAGDVIESRAIESSIEVATQVKITDEAIEAFGVAWHEADAQNALTKGYRRAAGIKAALTALGFEVIE